MASTNSIPNPPRRPSVAFSQATSQPASLNKVLSNTTAAGTGSSGFRKYSSGKTSDDRTSGANAPWKRPSVRQGSTTSTGSRHVGDSPARIFEHWRGPKSQVGPLGRATAITSPASFKETEKWLRTTVEECMQPGPDPEMSSIKILFFNEKKCKEVWKDEVFDHTMLHPILRIHDWTTAHYMSTFCRFPLPIDSLDPDDFDEDEDELPDLEQNHDWDWRYSTSHPFDWDMIWAYFPPSKTTIGIMRTWFDGYDTNFMDMESIVESFAGATLAHPVLVGLFSLQILTADAMANVREKGNRLFEAQKFTGFHVYNRLRNTAAQREGDSDGEEPPEEEQTDLDTISAEPDLGGVTRDVLGAASHLTGWDNATTQMVGFANFLVAENERFQTVTSDPEQLKKKSFRRICAYIDQQAAKQISDLDGAKRDSMAWLATASFLLQGVLNLVSQRDATANIELARSSNRIAMDAKRDATSMMSIAVLTMFFLPGTFTASFFALPFFQDSFKEISSFWVYWAVTVPLTAIVLVFWFLYVWWTKRPAYLAKEKKPYEIHLEKDRV